MQNTRLRDVELSVLEENDVMTVSRRYKLIGSGSGNGNGNGLLLEAAFGDEVGILRQPSIEEEDEQQVKSFSTPQEHRIQEEDKNSLTESKDVTESIVAGIGRILLRSRCRSNPLWRIV